MKRIISIVFLATMTFTVSMSAAKPSVDLTSKDVKSLIASAKTPSDHLKLAHYYDQRAQLLLAQSRKHEQMAEESRKNRMAGSKFFPMTAAHCEASAESYRRDAQQMQALAAEHKAMAEKAGM